MSADALQASIESLDRDGRLLALMEKLNRSHSEEIQVLHEEIAELRDGLLALSNRIESVTRAHVSAVSTEPRQPVRPLIHSVPAMPNHPRPS